MTQGQVVWLRRPQGLSSAVVMDIYTARFAQIVTDVLGCKQTVAQGKVTLAALKAEMEAQFKGNWLSSDEIALARTWNLDPLGTPDCSSLGGSVGIWTWLQTPVTLGGVSMPRYVPLALGVVVGATVFRMMRS
jgi:hypothetical protein